MRVLKALPLAGIFAAALAVAQPAYSAGSQIMYILDGSGSMRGQVDGAQKMATAKKTLAELVAATGKDSKIGLMAYGHTSKESCKDVKVVAKIGTAPKDVATQVASVTPLGKTPITYALEQASHQFPAGSDVQNYVVLVSDGKETCGGNPCDAAKALTEKGVKFKIHVVGFDVKGKERAELECIAKEGGGKYFNASNTTEFKEAVTEVQKQVAQAKPEPKPEKEEYFFDDFKGEVLGEHWEVVNPNTDAYIVEDGKLVVLYPHTGISRNYKKINILQTKEKKPAITNMFKLTKDLPNGDWTATIRFKTEPQSLRETMAFGIYNEADDYMLGFARSNAYCCNTLGYTLHGEKASGGGNASFYQQVLFTKTSGGRTKHLEHLKKLVANVDAILLRLEKDGRNYIFSMKLDGKDEKGKPFDWVTLQKLTALRQKGSLVFWPTQRGGHDSYDFTRGEGLTEVDWVKIETEK